MIPIANVWTSRVKISCTITPSSLPLAIWRSIKLQATKQVALLLVFDTWKNCLKGNGKFSNVWRQISSQDAMKAWVLEWETSITTSHDHSHMIKIHCISSHAKSCDMVVESGRKTLMYILFQWIIIPRQGGSCHVHRSGNCLTKLLLYWHWNF